MLQRRYVDRCSYLTHLAKDGIRVRCRHTLLLIIFITYLHCEDETLQPFLLPLSEDRRQHLHSQTVATASQTVIPAAAPPRKRGAASHTVTPGSQTVIPAPAPPRKRGAASHTVAPASQTVAPASHTVDSVSRTVVPAPAPPRERDAPVRQSFRLVRQTVSQSDTVVSPPSC